MTLRHQRVALPAVQVLLPVGRVQNSVRPLGSTCSGSLLQSFVAAENCSEHLRFGLSVVEAQSVFLFCLRLTSRALSKPVSELSSHRFLRRHLNWNKTTTKQSPKPALWLQRCSIMHRLIAIKVYLFSSNKHFLVAKLFCYIISKYFWQKDLQITNLYKSPLSNLMLSISLMHIY